MTEPRREQAGVDGPPPQAVLDVVRALVVEMQPHRAGARISLDSALERELGLDSLGRAELLLRLEAAFGIALPERVLADAETPRDLWQALRQGGPGEVETLTLAPPEESAVGAPDSAATLLDVLAWHRTAHPGRRHVLFLEGDGSAEELSYGQLGRRAERVAAGLVQRGVEPGQAVAMMLPSSTSYFAVFLGILLAGGVPVPLYPPARKSQVEDHLLRQAGILRNAGVRVLVAAPEVRLLARLVAPLAPELAEVTTPEALLSAQPDGTPLPTVRTGDTAFLQYTSGSTGDPKGVVLSHANLLANLRVIGRALGLGGDDVVVSWLPLYHDMGLIGAWMGSLYFGMPLVLMSPLSFLARPARWLQALSRYGGTVSAAPNFAYALCARKVADEDLAGLDLSRWRIALNGAEPVSPETMDLFTRRFAATGFQPTTMMPVYGLAEATLAVAFTPVGRGPKVDLVDRRAFQDEGRAAPAAADDPQPLRFVSCGVPVPQHEVRVADEAGHELPERVQGRLQSRGASTTSGYFRNPEATERLLRDGWLDTGDLGYVAEGEVYVTGRRKDLIIRAGRNIHPQEVEEAVGALDGVRKGCVAVFAVAGGAEGTERLVVMAEAQPGIDRGELRRRVDEVATTLVGAAPDEVALVPPGTVPKTSSGKIRRSAAARLYSEGGAPDRGRALWWQVARLAAAGVPSRLRRWRLRAGEMAYAAWWYAALVAVGSFAYTAMYVVPGRGLRRRISRGSARLLHRLTGAPLTVSGLEHLPEGACILTCNHQSYLDGFVLSAALPPRFGFVVKGELLGNPLTRIPLARLGALFVERRLADRGAEDAERTVATVKGGESLAIFPEGTFRRAPGLLPFRMGAFAVAARAGVPVVPVALRGTRTILRGEQWLPRRGPVTVAIGPPLHPAGDDWRAAVALRDGARAWMRERVGEPDLGDEPLALPPAT
jgi:acyl carrier protein